VTFTLTELETKPGYNCEWIHSFSRPLCL